MMMKQEGKAIDGEKGEGSIDLDTYNPHSPSYMLGPPSPTSMEWETVSEAVQQKIISLKPEWFFIRNEGSRRWQMQEK